jgi:hypothetical protein
LHTPYEFRHIRNLLVFLGQRGGGSFADVPLDLSCRLALNLDVEADVLLFLAIHALDKALDELGRLADVEVPVLGGLRDLVGRAHRVGAGVVHVGLQDGHLVFRAVLFETDSLIDKQLLAILEPKLYK